MIALLVIIGYLIIGWVFTGLLVRYMGGYDPILFWFWILWPIVLPVFTIVGFVNLLCGLTEILENHNPWKIWEKK